jgi:hypothetical protein
MKRLLVLLLIVGICGGCAGSETAEDQGTVAKEAAPPPASAANQLTPEEQQEGFTLLFDGQSLNGWVLPAEEGAWRIVDGVIENDAAHAGGLLMTAEDYTNYVLKLELRAHPQVNSGVMLRQRRPTEGGAQKKGSKKGGGPAHYEVQIRDKVTEGASANYLTASLAGMAMAPADATIRPGEWNSYEITIDGDHMVVVYNGRQTAEANDSQLTTGAIALESAHPVDPPEATIEFRNIKIKRLP